ncbi:hypothetical protein NLI96_g380 [Meripilus lineatus]|uniref:BAG domain-containing protein n=1 Tax=Meripilus lineatus TaxID=2056292 RepID=A0AAD5VCH4_9APHY|nr:hypothetical protein NLI96_g380 [Physisporinus lineatus]
MQFIFTAQPSIRDGHRGGYYQPDIYDRSSPFTDLGHEYVAIHPRVNPHRLRSIPRRREREIYDEESFLQGYLIAESLGTLRPDNHVSCPRHAPRSRPSRGEGYGFRHTHSHYHPTHFALDRHAQQDHEVDVAHSLLAALLGPQHVEAQMQASQARRRRQEIERHAAAIRRAEARAQQEAQLQALFGALYGDLLEEEYGESFDEEQVCHHAPFVPGFVLNGVVQDDPYLPSCIRHAPPEATGPTRTVPRRAPVEQELYISGHHGVPILNRNTPTPSSVDRKGKSREVPAIPFSKHSTPTHETTHIPNTSAATSSLLEELSRKVSEKDIRVQRAIGDLLLEDLYPEAIYANASNSKPSVAPSTSPQNKVNPKQGRFNATPENAFAQAAATTGGSNRSEGADLRRTHPLPPVVAQRLLKLFRSRRARDLSLGTIKDIEEELHSIQSSFTFPHHIDFPETELNAQRSTSSSSDSELKLAYTPNNKSIHAYEHALNDLLMKLDAIDSQGLEDVRGRRKEVVGEIERALNEVVRKVEDSRERASLSDKPVHTTIPLAESTEEPIIAHSGEPVATVNSNDKVTAPVPINIPVETVAAVGGGCDIPVEERVPAAREVPEKIETLTEEEEVGFVAEGEGCASSECEGRGEGLDVVPEGEATTEVNERVADVDTPVQPTVEAPNLSTDVYSTLTEPANSVDEVLPVTDVQEDTTSEELVEDVDKSTVYVEPPNLATEPGTAHEPGVTQDDFTDNNDLTAIPEEDLEATVILSDSRTRDSIAPNSEPSSLSVADPQLTPRTPSPNPSESGSERNSFLLTQTSPLADPGSKKANTQPVNEDDDIDVLSEGDFDDGGKESDGWSEVDGESQV